MTLKEIAIKNLLRRKGKAAFIFTGLVIGVATVVTVVSCLKIMTNDINHKLDKYGANILIIPKTDHLTLSYGGLTLGGVSFEMEEIKEFELTKINSIKNARNIAALGPMVLGGVTINDQRVLLAGIDFSNASVLKPWWKMKTGKFPNSAQIIAGSEAARVLNLDVNKELTLNGHPVQLSGVLNTTGSQDDHLIITSIGLAQKILDMKGVISMAEVAALCEACPIKEMVHQISQVLPNAKVMAIQQVVKGRMETIAQLKKISYGISAVVMIIGGLMVLVTMMGSVRERTEEIGIFRAIGFRKGHIVKLVFIEAGIISGLAGVIGFLGGTIATFLGIKFFSTTIPAVLHFNIVLASGAIITAVLIGLIASAYPAIMASRLDPNQALRAL